MNNLNDELDLLHKLNDLRDSAKSLRKSGLLALKEIKEITFDGEITPRQETRRGELFDYRKWLASANEVEAALLVKIQGHRDINEKDEDNDEAEASPDLKDRLKKISLESLFPADRQLSKISSGQDEPVPVLVAARAMQALVMRSETVFSRATMVCYYRIVWELYTATGPDWTIGAARANEGGVASAFITGECIRAILAFENAIRRTVEFFGYTRELSEKYNDLKIMLDGAGITHNTRSPLSKWADKAIERTWLDWTISTNRRRGEIAIAGIPLELPDGINMSSVGRFLEELPGKIQDSIKIAKKQMKDAEDEIDKLRKEQSPSKSSDYEKGYSREAERWFQQTKSAHELALRAVSRGITETEQSDKFLKPEAGYLTEAVDFSSFIRQFEDISFSIRRILEPAKQYVRTIVDRELSNVGGRFDAGELAFAAASFGAITGWKPNERLRRACQLLTDHLPDGGNLPTRMPIHATPKGYRLLPIGCEITRSFAQLLQRTGFEIEPLMVRRILNLFEENLIPLRHSDLGELRVGWNFDGSPDSDKPSVWVTAVAVLALDRVVRLLNERINAIVLRQFEVIRPEKPHTTMTLNTLIYSDYGFGDYYQNEEWRPTSIRLEQMRAHVMRATLPEAYKKEKVYAAILYGPPGTGKTTFAESLAFSSNVPLVRLSPSDLTVHGQELIEGRARVVFEALSMLTRAVIILDEFDPVLARRDGKREGASNTDRMFSFLLTGMLPKLLKLNEAAERQSLVYCLATNYINSIDDAAVRPGRFELQMPIYNPDPLSRAGTFLYRLTLYRRKYGKKNSRLDNARSRRLMEVLKATAGRPASELATDYFQRAYFDFYITGKDRPDLEPIEDTSLSIEEVPKTWSQTENDERDWINRWEDKIGSTESMDAKYLREDYLMPPRSRTTK